MSGYVLRHFGFALENCCLLVFLSSVLSHLDSSFVGTSIYLVNPTSPIRKDRSPIRSIWFIEATLLDKAKQVPLRAQFCLVMFSFSTLAPTRCIRRSSYMVNVSDDRDEIGPSLFFCPPHTYVYTNPQVGIQRYACGELR